MRPVAPPRRYADYENKAQRHTAAADAFAALAEGIAEALALSSDKAEAALQQSVAHLAGLTSLAQQVLAVGARLSGALVKLKVALHLPRPPWICLRQRPARASAWGCSHASPSALLHRARLSRTARRR